MPVNAIIAERTTTASTPSSESDAPPVDEPSDEPAEFTMRTPEWLPPFLHIDTIDGDGAIFAIGSVLTLLSAVGWVI